MSAEPKFVYFPDHEDEEFVFPPGDSRGRSFMVMLKAGYVLNNGNVEFSDNDPVMAPLITAYDLDPTMENTFEVPSAMNIDQMFVILAAHPEFERISPCPFCPDEQPCGY